MNSKVKKHLEQALSHLYINPLEKCNLGCKICYTRKTAPILSEMAILEFVERYQKAHKLEAITFCGGEVFTLPYFPALVNKLTAGPAARVSQTPLQTRACIQRSNTVKLKFGTPHSRHPLSYVNKFPIIIQIITNGTIDRLAEFKNPNMVNLIVSLDGLEKYHDANRGEGNFTKSIGLIKKAKKMGFHVEIFSIVTCQNFHQIDEFEQDLCSRLGFPLQVTYHPRKPALYLSLHPQSNIRGKVVGFDFLTDAEMKEIIEKRKTFPPKSLGCYQISLMSDGRVYGCCEGTVPLGKIDDDIKYLFGKLEKRLEGRQSCLGCSQPDFMCGMQKFYES